MSATATGQGRALTAVLIAPDRELAERFCATLGESGAFRLLADLKQYPSEQVLEVRLRQLGPEVVLLDVASDLEEACSLIRWLASLRPPVPVIGLDSASRPAAVMRALKTGAREFLAAPFDPAVQRDAVAGIVRQKKQESEAEPAGSGRVIAFTSAKPGAGASTLACQTAFGLERLTRQRVLLADLDMAGGSVGFYVARASKQSFLEVLEAADQPAFVPVESMAVDCRGVSVLAAPDAPSDLPLDPLRFRKVLEQLRRQYDWTLLDLPTIFHRVSLLALTNADRTLLVSTNELASLHLARRAVRLLSQLGVGREHLELVINQSGRQEGMSGEDLGKILGWPAKVSLPDDHARLHRAIALGEPLAGGSLAAAVDELAKHLAGVVRTETRKVDFVFDPGPVFAGT